MTRSQKRELYKIVAAAVLLIVATQLPVEGWLRLVAFLVPYLIVGGGVLWKAARNIARG